VIQWGGVLLAFLGIGAAFLLPALMSHSPAAEGSELWWWGDKEKRSARNGINRAPWKVERIPLWSKIFCTQCVMTSA
jgi:hypothetical protein